MAKYELELDTMQGRLRVPFDSVPDLEQKLKDLDFEALKQTLSLYLKFNLKSEPRKVKPTLEGICAFHTDGMLEFLRPPSSKLETIGLVLYAFDPDSVDVQTIGRLAAEKNPAAYLTHKKYSRYFSRVGAGLYALSHEGKIWVTTVVLPHMKAKEDQDVGSQD